MLTREGLKRRQLMQGFGAAVGPISLFAHTFPRNAGAQTATELEAGFEDDDRPLADDNLAVYSDEFGRTGFQGGLNGYRSFGVTDRQVFAGRTIDQPSMFIGGASDWGVYQNPGALEQMRDQSCTDMQGVHIVDGAGHWVQQEQPEETSRLLTEFLQRNG